MGLLSMLYRDVGRYFCTPFVARPGFCIAVLMKPCVADTCELPKDYKLGYSPDPSSLDIFTRHIKLGYAPDPSSVDPHPTHQAVD